MVVQSIEGKRYTLIVWEYCTRFSRVYFLRQTSDAVSAFESSLTEGGPDGTPSAVMVVGSDNGGEGFGVELVIQLVGGYLALWIVELLKVFKGFAR